ncbi:hypothetical protein ENH_00019670 [Eimeria necatrix]|uniref:Uncharacterized protein n=1 Tax=Eimeria necatrix TaxID=51315 RepID=U6MQ83_9EIME|nr:hypothetical protein ENH_00019670 [Eimeria necatrix]CDJ66377.1 hypothetical protein ENH_00019670 [Eimeria necatrix]
MKSPEGAAAAAATAAAAAAAARKPLVAKEAPVWRPDDVEKIVAETLDDLLRGLNYEEVQANKLLDKICDCCMQRLAGLKGPFKFVVHAAVAERGAGNLTFATAAQFVQGHDG